MIGSQLGNYIITGEAGSGGMGTVYLARHAHLTGRTVAIKVMPEGFANHPQLVERFKREADVMCSLEHANIVKVSDFGVDERTYYFVMEYVEGRSLDKVLHLSPDENTPLPVHQAVEVFRQICDALEYAHSRGVVHRDLKPGNILVRSQKSEVRSQKKDKGQGAKDNGRDQKDFSASSASSALNEQSVESVPIREIRGKESGIHVKLTDFGLAKILENVRRSSTGHLSIESGPVTGAPTYKTPHAGVTGEPTIQQTPQVSMEGQVLGTFDYMSPEQKRGKLNLDARSDIFSLGVVLFEMLTGEVPTGFDTASTLNPSVPKEIDAVITKALRAKPEQRYQSVAEFRKSVENLTEPQRAQREDTGKKVEVKQGARRGRRVAVALIILLALAVGAIALFSALSKSAPPDIGGGTPITEEKIAADLFDAAKKKYDDGKLDEAAADCASIASRHPSTKAASDASALKNHIENKAIPPPPEQKGLRVESEPPGAVITLNGEKLADKTPFLFKDLATGTHKIKVALDGYIEEEQTFYYSKGDDKPVKFTLKYQTGGIVVRVPEAGFRVKLAGPEPEEITTAGTTHTFSDKRVGKYRVVCERTHYDKFERDIVVEYGKTTTVTNDNKPRPGSVLVESEPSGAEIYLNDEAQSRGKTPKTIEGLAPGKYKIRLVHTKEGESKQEEVEIRSDDKSGLLVKDFMPQAPAGFKAVEAEGRDEATGLWKEIVHEKTGIVLRLIPAGEFDMGSPDSEKERQADEGPVHRVKISKPFYMGKYEVTQKQWVAVMGAGNNPSNWKGDNLPVERVSWNDIQGFLPKAGGGMRLPTEAEWEYACRAGSTGRWCFGDDASQLGNYAWYNDNSGSKTHDVGGKKPNAWGLYDMHGNVWEWCSDWYGEKYYDECKGGVTDPQGPANGGSRLLRGGSWYVNPWFTRAADRYWFGPDFRLSNYGFRVVVPARAVQ